MKKYGVQKSNLTEAILVGRLNEDNTQFIDKEDMTTEVLSAVTNLVKDNYDGDVTFHATDTQGRHVTLSISTKISEEEEEEE